MSKCCNIYNNSFINDLKSDSNVLLDSLSSIRSLMRSYSNDISGIWMPLYINTATCSYANLLMRGHPSMFIDPCNCDPSMSGLGSSTQSANCEYCYDASTNTTIIDGSIASSSWNLTTLDDIPFKTYQFDPCKNMPGNIDVRANYDDIVPKIPVLDNSYITGSYDFKYFNEFPARQCTPDSLSCGFGWEGFAKYTANSSLNSFTTHPELRIDWKISERMGEIPFDGKITHHKDVGTHIKSYEKFLNTGKTCGNFILMKGSGFTDDYPILDQYKDSIPSSSYYPSDDTRSALQILPSDEEFTIPYGTKYPEYNNVFIGKEKLLSHWKWQYNKAVLCWYRYSDIKAINDQRPIPGVDLYISEGDIFWAKNFGPEKSFTVPPSEEELLGRRPCPRGTKVVKGGKVIGVLPESCEFLYVSKTIYSRFLKILDRLEKNYGDKFSVTERIERAAVEATAPPYEEITLDLIKKPFASSIPLFKSTQVFLNSVDGVHISGLEKFRNEADITNVTTWPNYFKSYAKDAGYDVSSGYKNEKANIQMSSKTNDNMSEALGISNFRHQPSVSRVNYISDKSSLINTLASKYGSYLWIPPNSSANITLKEKSELNSAFILDFDVVCDVKVPTRTPNPPQCSITSSKEISYNQSFSIGNTSLQTNFRDSNVYQMSCVSGVKKRTNVSKVYELAYKGSIVDAKPVFTGVTSFKDIYYGPSYDLALMIDGVELCKDSDICDKKLAKLYPNKIGYDFQDKNIYVTRNYNGYFLNPNLDIVAFNEDGGLYYESNVFGKKTIFKTSELNSSTSNNLGVSFGFQTEDVGIKLYSVKLEKLRNKTNSACKTFPLNNVCNCEPIPIMSEFPYSCDSNRISYANNSYGTPNLSTNKTTVSNSTGTTPLYPVTKYIDPKNPYGCVKEKTISLPYYTNSQWSLQIFPYDPNFGDLWVSIGDGKNLTTDRVQIRVDVGGSQVFNNQLRKVTTDGSNRVSVSITDPFLTSFIGNKQLYTPLACSVDKDPNDRGMSTVNIRFKYIPKKHNLLFSHHAPIAMGTLNPVGYSLEKGLSSNANTDIVYDEKTYSFGFEDSAFKRTIDGTATITNSQDSKKFFAPITPELKKIVDNLDNFDTNKKLKLYITVGGQWHYFDVVKSFSYENDNNKYIGYPLLFEYQGSQHTKKLKSFIPSFISERPNLVYFINSFSYKNLELSSSYLPIFTQQFYSNKTFHNFINMDGFRPYFFVKGVDPEFMNGASYKDPLIPDTFEVPSTLYLNNHKRSSLFGDIDTIICTEPCFIAVKLRTSRSTVYAHITDKYLFKDSSGKYYTSFRLIPIYNKTLTTSFGETILVEDQVDILTIFNGEPGYIDFYSQIDSNAVGTDRDIYLTSLTLGRSIDRVKNELDLRLSNRLYDHKWSDIYDFVGDVKTFDILNSLKTPKFDISYNNLFISTMNYMNNIYKFKKQHVPFYISPSGFDGDKNIEMGTYTYCTPPSDCKQTMAFHKKNDDERSGDSDYYLPFLDINYFSKRNSILNPQIINFARTDKKLLNGSIVFSGLFTSKFVAEDTGNRPYLDNNIINPHHNSGYFWINLSNKSFSNQTVQCLPNIFNSNFLNPASVVDQPAYILKKIINTETILNTTATCTNIIKPIFIATEDDDFYFRELTSTKYDSQTYASHPIYCDLSRVNGCDTQCGLNSSYGQINARAQLSVAPIPTPIDFRKINGGMSYFLTYDNGLYSNVKSVVRNMLDSTNSVLYPGTSYDSDDLNNNVQKQPALEPSIYSRKVQGAYGGGITLQSSNVNNLDILANEMLYRLFNGSKQFINTETIGRKSQEEFYKRQKLLSLKNLLQNNSPVDPSKVYELIPYDFDIKSDSSLRKISGNINIDGIINVGDVATVTFNGKTLRLSIEQTDTSIDLVATFGGKSKRITLKTIKTTSSNLYPIPKNSGPPADYQNTSYYYVGSCTIYGGKGFFATNYYTSAVVNGIDLVSEIRHAIDVGTRAAQQGIYYCRFGEATAALNEERPVNGAIITADYCSFNSTCDGITYRNIALEDTGSYVAKSVHKIIPGGRSTYSTCVGCVVDYASVIEGQPGGRLAPPRTPGPLLSATNEGDVDQLAGGAGLNNPIVLSVPNCSYVGCGAMCLPINYSDKLGATYLSNFNIGYRTMPPGQPCECIPYELGKCQKPTAKACVGDCNNREYSPINYTIKNGNYTFLLDGYKSRDKNTSSPTLAPQTPFSFPDITNLAFDWSLPPKDDPANKATEVCAFVESISPDSPWDIYEGITTNTNEAKFSDCPESFATIRFSNKKLYVNETLCFDIDLISSCPSINVTLPNDSYSLTNDISSECSMCDINENSVTIVDNKNPTWETVIETRNYILGEVLPIEGDLNYTVVGGGIGNVPGGCCGPMPPPTCCGNRCLSFYGGFRQCGKSAPDSFPWRYCLHCSIPGSRAPALQQANGGSSAISYLYGGGVTDCIPFSYPNNGSSPQIKAQVLAEWRKRKQLAFNDFIPCKNNQSINVEDLIEGIIPGTCQLNYTTLSFPLLGYRRTYEGSESKPTALGVHVAYISYQYKRPKTIDDVLIGEQCVNYYNKGAAPKYTPNIVEKYVNGGICENEIGCKETVLEQCNKNNYCCRSNKMN